MPSPPSRSRTRLREPILFALIGMDSAGANAQDTRWVEQGSWTMRLLRTLLAGVALIAAMPVVHAAPTDPAAPAAHAAHAAQTGPSADSGAILALGVVEFANSGAPAAQAMFQRGLALLHSFEYDHAAKAFQQAQAIDPDFAMAYWGEALTKNYSLWSWQDRDAANAILNKLAPTAKARAAKAGTEREKAYLAALDVLFGEGTKLDRDRAYIDAMAAIHARWPDDVDAAAFHALAIFGAEHDGRDVAAYMRSAAILEEVYPAHSSHPGVLHYMIHSYDDPDHAPLGLRAARRYGKVAPGAAHALHMNSHIFVALGMWPETVDANLSSVMATDREYAAEGKGKSWCGHAHSWLVYGYLQSGEDAKAREYIDGCWSAAMAQIAAKPGDDKLTGRMMLGSAFYVQTMDAAQNGTWKVPDGMPWRRLDTEYRFYDAYGRMLAAYHADDASKAAEAAADVRAFGTEVLGKMSAEDRPTEGPGIEAAMAQAKGLAALATGQGEAALTSLREAVAIEDATPMQYGPPMVAKPSHELLGEVLLDMDRKAEAATVFAAALRRTPNRGAAVAGSARASK
ncbi:tetratricopeptide repeat protein [Croceicoccus ponticola]|nr:tetratricopeptide repeat protein [Croceicoccus ponticola]